MDNFLVYLKNRFTFALTFISGKVDYMTKNDRNHAKLNTVEEAIKDIRNGKIVIVVDDEDRENEGDFICAAELATPEIVNFMAIHGRGLICAPLPEERCEELKLKLMVPVNTSLHATPFTVSLA